MNKSMLYFLLPFIGNRKFTDDELSEYLHAWYKCDTATIHKFFPNIDYDIIVDDFAEILKAREIKIKRECDAICKINKAFSSCCKYILNKESENNHEDNN